VWLLSAPGLITVLLLAGAWLTREWFLSQPVSPPEPSGEGPARFRVQPGEPFSAVAARLEEAGWIPWSVPARLEARVLGWDRRVFPGYYEERPGERVRGLLRRLRLGEIEHVMVTIPEGRRISQVLPLLAESTWNRLEEFEVLSRDEAWLSESGIPGPGLEGYVLPETYKIALGAEPAHVLEQVTQPAVRLYEDSLRTRAEALGLSARELWTLASLVEAEAARPEEQRRIAGVFWNRLRRGMKLECDPTVLYALGRSPGRVLYRDLEVDSPYNTYRYPGLPPGPICLPGRGALTAAVDPMPVDELFFVARGDGSHVFSRTLAEHNRARIEIRRSP
jgi:UPF0755 protein